MLIVPIQRVPRYRLLLSELLSHTSESDAEYPVLCEALKQVEAVAVHINEQIREQENMQIMIRIQRSLAHGRPRIVIPGRRFIKGKKTFLEYIPSNTLMLCHSNLLNRRKAEKGFF